MNEEQQVTLINKNDLINEMKQILNIEKQEILYILKNRKNDNLYNTKELAKYFQVSQTTINNWRLKGIVKPISIQGKVYYKYEDIQQLINNNYKHKNK